MLCHKLSAVVATALFSAMSAQATVIDFQSLEHVDSGNVSHGTSYSEDGFTVALAGAQLFELNTFGTLEARYTGSTAMFNNNADGVISLTKIGGGTFNLFSIDLAELDGSFPATVTFTDNDGDVIAFALDGIAFGAQTFSFDSRFLGITSVSWAQTAAFHQFDNICIDERSCAIASVPEPGTLALLGIAGLAAWRRRNVQ
jgi:hypothetical protein